MISIKRIFSTALAVHLAGSICMMPMASAIDWMPMDHDGQEMMQVTEIAMTPANLMSPVDCDGCVTITRPRSSIEAAANSPVPCNDGHCMSQHLPTAAISPSPLKDATKTAILVAISFYLVPLEDVIGLAWHERPPMQELGSRTIVMRK
jgi:hypothetical protein